MSNKSKQRRYYGKRSRREKDS